MRPRSQPAKNNNSDVALPPLAIITILLWFGGLLLAWNWTLNGQLEVDGPGLMHVDQQNRLWLSHGTWIQVFDDEQQLAFEIDRDQLKLSKGDFLPWDDQSFIAVNQGVEPNFGENLRTFFRLQPAGKDQSTERWIMKCDLAENNCSALSAIPPALPRSYRLAKTSQNHLLVANTSRHKLQLYDLDGKLLKEKEGFRFPNSLREIDGEQLVVDTNHHRLVSFSHQLNQFGETLWQKKFSSNELPNTFSHWPVDVAKLGDSWFVLLKDHSMSVGSILHLQKNDGEWRDLGWLALPEEREITALAVWQNSLLASDQMQKVHRFNAQGEPQQPFNPPALMEKTQKNQVELAKWEKRSHLIIAIALLSFAVMFYFAIRQSLNLQPRESIELSPEQKATINWFSPRYNSNNILVVVSLITLAVYSLLGWAWISEIGYPETAFLYLAVAPWIGFAVWMASKTRIGIYDHGIIIEDHFKQQAYAKNEQLIYKEPYLIIGKKSIWLGSEVFTPYSYEAFNQQIKPLLYFAAEPKQGEMTMRLIQAKQPMVVIGFLMLPCLLAIPFLA